MNQVQVDVQLFGHQHDGATWCRDGVIVKIERHFFSCSLSLLRSKDE